MFGVGDFVKDRRYNHSRNIYCAKVEDVCTNESGHEEVKLTVYNSSTGVLWDIWVDEYRLRHMTIEERGYEVSNIVKFYEGCGNVSFFK